MPYYLEHKKNKGYKVHLIDNPDKIFSKKYQTKKTALAQIRAIEMQKHTNKNISGGSIKDVIRKVKNTVNNIVSIPTTIASRLMPERLQYTDSARGMINKYGNFEILELKVEKEPVNNGVMYLADTLSNFELKAIMQKTGIDKFYHLSMVAKVLTDTKQIIIRIEKNENITLEIYKKRPNTQQINIDLNQKRINIRDLLEKTRLMIGNDHYFKYRWDSWNCADFIIQILQSNGLLKPADYDFIWQNADIIKRNMSSGSANRMHLLTKLGSYISHLRGGELKFI